MKWIDRLKKGLRKFPRLTFTALAIGVIALMVVTPKLNDYFEPSPLSKPVPAPVYPQITLDASLPVRKSVVDLTDQEKTALVNAIKALNNTFPNGSNLSRYEQFVLQHVLTMGFDSGSGAGTQSVNPAHGQAAFLPWHRQFLREFERALQAIDSSVTVPYWDWTDPKALQVILQADFLGGNGQGVNIELPGVGTFTGGAVNTGPCADWTLKEALHFESYTGKSFGPKLLRFVAIPPFNQYPLPKLEVEQLLAYNHYSVFNALIEGAEALNQRGKFTDAWMRHAAVHTLVGGTVVEAVHLTHGLPKEIRTLGTMESIPCSPYDPIFWLLHANVDRLWAEWQDRGHTGHEFFPATGNPMGHNLNDPMWPWDGGRSTPRNLGPGNLLVWLPTIATHQVVTPADVLDFRTLGYTYHTTRFVNESHHS